MPNYVARATVQAELPTGYAAAGLDNDTIDEYIGRASLRVDELAGVDFPLAYETDTQKFPEIDDGSYTTPATIEDCALWLTLVKCYIKLGEKNRIYEIEKRPAQIYYRELAIDTMKQVRDGDIDLGITKNYKFYATEKYPDDETDFDRTFTNTELDAHLP